MPEEITEPTGTAQDGDLLYELRGAGFSVAGTEILAPVDLALPASRICGLIGPNGSGKTSLLRLLGRQQARTAGDIRLLGRPLDDYGDREFARHVAYMPQFSPPADGMSVRELVALGRFPWHGAHGRFTAADAAKVDEALDQTGLADFAGRLVDTLSGGERQRAWLAMMLAQDTRCLLLDEPTSALDIAHQVEVLALVRALGRKRAIGAVIVLHDINMAARHCDELVALRRGRIVARGTPHEIVRPDVLAGIYGVAMGTLPHPSGGPPLSYVR